MSLDIHRIVKQAADVDEPAADNTVNEEMPRSFSMPRDVET